MSRPRDDRDDEEEDDEERRPPRARPVRPPWTKVGDVSEYRYWQWHCISTTIAIVVGGIVLLLMLKAK